MERIRQVMPRVISQLAENTTDSEYRSRLTDEARAEYDKKVKFWEEHPFIQFKAEEIEKLLFRTVPRRFVDAKKDDIEPKVWSLAEPFFIGNGLFLWGKPGTGKTHLCAALIREYYMKNPRERKYNRYTSYGEVYAEYTNPPSPEMITVPDLFFQIKASFGRQEKNSEDYRDDKIPFKNMTDQQLIDEYSRMPVLFLDDIGTEKTTDWAQQTLYTIIDRRYREMKQTVITSNLSLNELSDKTGDRITSRIAEMCKVIELKGKDRRIK